MSIDWNKCFVNKSGNVVLPKGKMVYPALLEPSAMKGAKPEDAKYQVTILLPAGADLTALKEKIAEAASDAWGANWKTKFKVRLPLLSTADQPKLAAYADEFPLLVRLKAANRPDVVHPNGKKHDDENDEYSGRWACASVGPFAYDHPTGGKGISLGLRALVLLDHDDVLIGRASAESEFEGMLGGSTTDELI